MRVIKSIMAAIAAHAALPNAHHAPSAIPKVKKETRAMALASGDVAYTGYGFTPTGLIIIGGVAGRQLRCGAADSLLAEGAIGEYQNDETRWDNNVVVNIGSLSTSRQSAIVKSYDADGFTLTWTKAGTPAGTANLFVIAFA